MVVVGGEYLPKSPALLNSSGDGFIPSLFDTAAEAERLVVRQESALGPWGEHGVRERAIRDGEVSAVMLIARELPVQLQRDQENEIDIPIQYNSVDEPSQTSHHLRLRELVLRQAQEHCRQPVSKRGIRKTRSYAEPIQVKAEDVATARGGGGKYYGAAGVPSCS